MRDDLIDITSHGINVNYKRFSLILINQSDNIVNVLMLKAETHWPLGYPMNERAFCVTFASIIAYIYYDTVVYHCLM